MLAADAFVRTILDRPDELGPRLVYADWLDEQGDPLGELIRLQCMYGHWSPDDPMRKDVKQRERELLDRYDSVWLQPIRDMGLSGRFRRGLLEVAVTGVRTYLEQSRRLLGHHWVLHVHLKDSSASLEDVSELARDASFARLQRLELNRAPLGNEGIRRLAASPFSCRLSHLSLNHVGLSTTGVKTLLDGIDVSRLQDLRFYQNEIGAAGARALAMTPRLSRLHTLDLSFNRLGTVGGEYLAESLFLTHLQALFVKGNNIGPRGKRALRRRFGPRVHLGLPEIGF